MSRLANKRLGTRPVASRQLRQLAGLHVMDALLYTEASHNFYLRYARLVLCIP